MERKDKMKTSEILLTISILVSGEPERARRCLSSLDKLRDAVNCELLITDTGCDEGTKQVIAEYADRILPFTWCKDFSKARNLGLSQAKGQWFMYLDDDEWFQDTEEMIAFFVSGEEKNYNMAYYIQRNYEDIEGKRYVDCPVMRMVRRTTDTTFIYAIHESLYPFEGPEKHFSSFVHHYGYVFADPQEKQAKHDRNIGLLLKEKAEHPDEVHHIMQLAQEYFSAEHYEESLSVSEEGIAVWNAEEGNTKYFYINFLYASVAQCLLKLERFEEVIERCESFLKDPNTSKITKIVLYGRLVRAFYGAEKYEECIYFTQKYLAMYEEYQIHPENFRLYATSINNVGATPGMLHAILSCGICAGIKIQMWEKALEWSELLSTQEGQLYITNELPQCILEAIDTQDEKLNTNAVTICNYFLRRQELEESICYLIRRKSGRNIKHYQGLQSNHWYIAYLKLQWAVQEGGCCEDVYMWDLLWQEPEKLLKASVELGLWKLFRESGREIGVELKHIPYCRWCHLIERWSEGPDSNGFTEFVKELSEGVEEPDDRIAFGELVLIRKRLQNTMESKGQRDEILGRYLQLNCFLYEELFTQAAVQNYFERLPLDYQLALLFSCALEEERMQNWVEVVRFLDKIRLIYPSCAEMVKQWLQEIKTQSQRVTQENTEFHALAQQVKKQVIQLLAEGNTQGALEILVQLEQMLPGDPEVAALKQKVTKLNT